MPDLTTGSILNFDAGISRVIWQQGSTESASLPDKRQLAPSELAVTQQLDRLLQVDNIDAALARALRPTLSAADVLRPDRFEAALHAAGNVLQRAATAATPEDRQALDGLHKVLREQGELLTAFNYYRDMLIAG